MDKTRFSVAMCTYNGAKYLKEQLDSIASQTRMPDELVICDDGSKDDTIKIINNFAASSSFSVRLFINEMNIGTIKNFEKAISRCSGDIIALSDQDDVWHPQKLEKFEKVFIGSSSVGAIFSDAEVVDEKLQPEGYTLWQSIRFTKNELKQVSDGKALEVLLRYNIAAGATLAFRSSYKKFILPIPKDCLHDTWIMLISAIIGNIEAINEPLIKYRQHKGQQTGVKSNGILISIARDELRGITTDIITYFDQRRRDHMISLYKEQYLYSSVYERISLVGKDFDKEKISRLDSKIGHLNSRIEISKKRRIYRIPQVLNEVFILNYDKYSNGLFYVVDDLIL